MPLPLSRADAVFDGFVRAAGRGAGTRNYLVLLPLSSRVGSFARALERTLRAMPDAAPTANTSAAIQHAVDELDASGHAMSYGATRLLLQRLAVSPAAFLHASLYSPYRAVRLHSRPSVVCGWAGARVSQIYFASIFGNAT